MRGAWLLLLVLAFPAKAQTDYEVRLFRPGKANDQYRLSASGSQSRRVELRNAAGEVQRSQRDSFSVDLSGSVRVLEVDAKGNVLAAAITVDSLVRAVGLERQEILKPGTVVTERRGGARQEFRIDGRPVEPMLKDALDVVLSETSDPAAPSDDELMGTRERQRIGARWPVNRERLARFFTEDRELALTVKAEDIEGASELAALSRCAPGECLRVNVVMSLLGSPREEKPAPGRDKLRIAVKVSTLLPVDPRLDALEESTQMTMTLAAPAGPAQEGRAPGRLVTSWEQRTERKIRHD